MSDAFDLDPERRLWKPNRRSFVSLMGLSIGAVFLPDVLSDHDPFRGMIITTWDRGTTIVQQLEALRQREKASLLPKWSDFDFPVFDYKNHSRDAAAWSAYNEACRAPFAAYNAAVLKWEQTEEAKDRAHLSPSNWAASKTKIGRRIYVR